jgi:hypothetical protein
VLAYTPLEYAEKITNLTNRAYSFRVVTLSMIVIFRMLMAENWMTHFRDNGFKDPSGGIGLASLDSVSESLDILVIVPAHHGSVDRHCRCHGSDRDNGYECVERTREIGIMRAIGADDRAVMRTMIGRRLCDRYDLVRFGYCCFNPVYVWAFLHCQSGCL